MRLTSAALLAAGLIAAGEATAQNAKASSAPGAAAAAPRVNVNAATAAQIAYLPRIGPTVAARVVDYRKAHGPFQRVEDLMEVKGIGEKLFLTVKPYVALNGPTTATHKLKAPARAASTASAPKPAPKPAAKPAVAAGSSR
ncbi:MAG TPA: helix-hairpin-helix domain-containing protein [Thermoanaerobaculia bacterium]|jgi:competence ComEA-like helix-hairpin-helix protein